MKVAKISDPAFLYSAALQKRKEDTFVRYTPTNGATGQPGMQRII